MLDTLRARATTSCCSTASRRPDDADLRRRAAALRERSRTSRVHVIPGTEIGDDHTDLLGVPLLRRGVPDIATPRLLRVRPARVHRRAATPARACSASPARRSTSNVSSSRSHIGMRSCDARSRRHRHRSSASSRSRSFKSSPVAATRSATAQSITPTTARDPRRPPSPTDARRPARHATAHAGHHAPATDRPRRPPPADDARQRAPHDRRRPVRQPVRHGAGAGHAAGQHRSPASPRCRCRSTTSARPRSASRPNRCCSKKRCRRRARRSTSSAGATYTSESYAQSLQSALDKAQA